MSSMTTALGALHLLGDPTRVRLLALLAHHPLTVADLTTILRLPQSRVSTHLGRLKESRVVRDQRRGSSTVYALTDGDMPEEVRRVWSLFEAHRDDATLRADRERCDGLLKARQRDLPWPDALAGEMERHYSPGRTWDALARALVGLVRLGDVLDVGAGDGSVAQLLASRARTYTLFDRSERMLAAARGRLARTPRVHFLHGDVHAIPQPDAAFDAVLALNVLTYAERPALALAECGRVLRPGGTLVLVTLAAHAHAEVTTRFGHVHQGFRPAHLRRWLQKAGLEVSLCDVTSRERREPQLSIVSAYATKPDPNGASRGE